MSHVDQSSNPTTPTQRTAFLDARLSSRDLENSHSPMIADEGGSILVGSPDQFHGDDQVPLHLTSNVLGLSTSVPRSRPIPISRLSPSPLFTRRRAANARVASGLSSLVMGTPESDHQWSLFGQLMENEGQLPLTSTTPGGRRLSTSTSGHPILQGSRNSTSNLTHSSITDPFLDTHTVTDRSGQSALRPPFDASSSKGPAPDTNNDDYDSSDSDSDEETEPSISAEPSPVPWYSLRRIPSVPILYRHVLKCAIAYFIASLFTFNPFLANLLSKITLYGDMDHRPGPREPFPSGHMVASMSVVFYE